MPRFPALTYVDASVPIVAWPRPLRQDEPRQHRVDGTRDDDRRERGHEVAGQDGGDVGLAEGDDHQGRAGDEERELGQQALR